MNSYENKKRKIDSRWIRPHVETPSTVLLLASLEDMMSENKYENLMTATTVAPNQEMALVITYSPDPWLSDEYINISTNLDIICIDDNQTTVNNHSNQNNRINHSARDVIQDPADLAAIENTVDEYINKWDDIPITIFFDSLTHLLSYRNLSDICEFIRRMSDNIEKYDIIIYFYIDIDECNTEVISELKPLFDATAELTAGKTDWAVNPRYQ